MEIQQEQKMRGKFSKVTTWPNANRIHKYGGRWFEETDLHMVFTSFYSIFYTSGAFSTH